MELHHLLEMDDALDTPAHMRKGTATAQQVERTPYQRMTGWRREKPEYWSEDALLSWRGACPHPNCGCMINYSPVNMQTERSCTQPDCPWDELRANEVKPEPARDVVELHRRFSGIDFD